MSQWGVNPLKKHQLLEKHVLWLIQSDEKYLERGFSLSVGTL